MPTIKCPNCHESIRVASSVKVLDNVRPVKKARVIPTRVVQRKISKSDRRAIKYHHRTNWRNLTKESLSQHLKLTLGQIAAVCAWQHPNLRRKAVHA
jgi:hypothetical protein